MMADDLKAKGNAALQVGDYRGALEHYTEAIKLDPTNHVLFSNRSAVYCKLLDYDAALSDANECTRLCPKWGKGYLRKGAAYEFLGKRKDAIEAYNEGLEHEPGNELLLSSLDKIQDNSFGMDSMFSGPHVHEKLKSHKATKEYMKDPTFLEALNSISRNPKSLSNYMGDPRILTAMSVLIGVDPDKLNMGDMDDLATDGDGPFRKTATKPEKKVADEVPTESEAQIERGKGNAAYKRKDFETALIHYDKGLELDPVDIAFHNNKAAVYFEMGEYEKCIKMCEEAVEVGREHRAEYKLIARAYARMAGAYQKCDDYENAKKFYEKSVSEFRAPDVVKKLQDLNKLIKEREKLSYINPEKAEEEKNKGNEAFRKGNFPEAVKHYSEAILRNPDDAKLYSNRAASYTKLMEFPSALNDCSKCIELDPTFLKGHLRKGSILMAMQEYGKAYDAYQKALEIDPNCYEALDGRRQALSKDSDPASAKRRVMNDPELQQILSDPAMQVILGQMQDDPAALQEYLKDPVIAEKFRKLMSAGVVGFRQ